MTTWERIFQAIGKKAWEEVLLLVQQVPPSPDAQWAARLARTGLAVERKARLADWWQRAVEILEGNKKLALYYGEGDLDDLPRWAAIGCPEQAPLLYYGDVPFEKCPARPQERNALARARAFAQRSKELLRRAQKDLEAAKFIHYKL